MINRYGIIGCLKLIVSVIYTKIFFPRAKILRLPIDLRNAGLIQFGRDMVTGFGCRFEAYSQSNEKQKLLIFGDNVEINDYVHITAMQGVSIGNNVLIASKVYISDSTHGSYSGDEYDSSPHSIPKERPLVTKKVTIGDNVWLGEFVSVLPGVNIGSGTIVGANSVVTKSLPANVIAVGSPAIPIKRFNGETQRWEMYKKEL